VAADTVELLAFSGEHSWSAHTRETGEPDDHFVVGSDALLGDRERAVVQIDILPTPARPAHRDACPSAK
jgi:hypothetical protein